MMNRTKVQIDNFLGGFLHSKNILPDEKKQIGEILDTGNYDKKEQFLDLIQGKHRSRLYK